MGQNNNQKFTNIPHYQVIQLLTYKAKLYGIEVISQPEAYTSQTSFLDSELPVWKNGDKARQRFGKTPVKRRLRRGLFKTNSGYLINADVNGALQIAHKYDSNYNLNAFCDKTGAKASREQIVDVVLRPMKWTPYF